MAAPDLSTPEGVRAYRAELKAVGRLPRLIGFALILLGAAFVVGVGRGWLGLGQDSLVIGYGALAVGWASMITAFVLRNRHHRRRMAQG